MATQPAPHLAGAALPVADARGNSPDGPAGRWLDGVFYPASDGQPMADNSSQAAAMMTAAKDLQTHYPHAFVTTDMLLYYERGVVDRRTAPDVLVAFDVGSDHRSSYVVWEEGKPPDWVLEVASRSTVAKDVEEKGDIYQTLRVPEYWLFDPEGGVLPAGQPRLQGMRLCHGEYVPIQPWIEGGQRLLRSEALGLDVRAEGKLLRFRDPVAGEDLLHQDEEKARADRETAIRQAETARADREAAARVAALARVAELEATIGRLQRRN